jgi:hypothetical protein
VVSEAYWRFETGDPVDADDDSGNRHTGTITGATPASGAPALPSGVPNALSLLFDAEGDYVTIPTAGTDLDVFPDGITVEAFVDPEVLPIPVDGAGRRIRYIVWADDDMFSLSLRSDELGATTLVASVNTVNGGPGPCLAGASAPFDAAGDFTHVALSYADETLRLYIDGVEVASDAASSGCGSQVGPIGGQKLVRIGNDETATCCAAHDRNWRGRIDEVRISPGALLPVEFLNAVHDLTVRFDSAPGSCVDTTKARECTTPLTLSLRNQGFLYAEGDATLLAKCKLGAKTPSCKLSGLVVPTLLDLGALGPHRVALYLSADDLLGADDPLLGALDAGRFAKAFLAGKTLKLKLKLPKGLDVAGQRLIAVVNEAGSIPESDAANNADASDPLPPVP